MRLMAYRNVNWLHLSGSGLEDLMLMVVIGMRDTVVNTIAILGFLNFV